MMLRCVDFGFFMYTMRASGPMYSLCKHMVVLVWARLWGLSILRMLDQPYN